MLLPRYCSPFQRHHYRYFNGISCTFPCNLHALPLFSSFCLTFSLRNDCSRAQRISAAWHFSSFTQLHTETTLHPAPPLFFCGRSPLFVFAPSTAAYTCRFAYRTVFAVFCVFSFVPCFFACQFSRGTIAAIFSVGGHSYIVDLTFRTTNCHSPTRCCIPYVRSGLSQLVISVKGFRVCALHCVRAVISISHLHSKFCPVGVNTTLSVSRVLRR